MAPLFRLAGRLLAGKGPDMRGVETVAAQELRIDGARPVQIDGDDFGSAPVTIRAIPGFVRLVV
jgi:diacylglycerol kinase family enzyme